MTLRHHHQGVLVLLRCLEPAVDDTVLFLEAAQFFFQHKRSGICSAILRANILDFRSRPATVYYVVVKVAVVLSRNDGRPPEMVYMC